MKEVIGVRFRENGKIYFFDPLKFNVQVGEFVIVETARGVEYGKVVLGRREIDEKKMNSAIKPIIETTKSSKTTRKRTKRLIISALRKSKSIVLR